MVLSSFSNWEIDIQNVNSEPILQTKTVQADQLVAGDDHDLDQHPEYYWDPFELPSAFLDPYIDLNNNFLHPENYTPLLPYDPLISLPPEIIPYENFSSYPRPKHQKLIEDHYLMPGFFDGVALNSCPVLEDHQQSMNRINLEEIKTVANISDEKCATVQSIGARERRRKITKKTQELGKLVPRWE